MQSRWVLPGTIDLSQTRRLREELAIPQLLAQLLVLKGYAEPESAEEFLHPKLKSLADPFLLPDMKPAVERLDAALKGKQRIMLYGDYDVDGVTSLALLARVLRELGGLVECFLPVRADEGYGLSAAGLERCFEQFRPDLLIAVDCGTNSTAEIASIRRAGVDVMVFDHHEFAGVRPDCHALVNPKTGTDFHYLCSAGVCFKVLHGLLKVSPASHVDLRDYLDLVALGTLADLVPVLSENRVLVQRGLRQMEITRWPGLSALIAVTGVTPPIRGGDVGFRLGPRINAAGRLGTAEEALQLLLTNDAMEATLLAQSLDAQNRERQTVEKLVTREVEQWVETHYDAGRHASIVVGAKDWHHGVLGIVASRISRRYHRPALVIGFDDAGEGKGSGRSIEGLSLVDALRRCETYLGPFGGHEMAVGLSVQETHFSNFQAAFEETVRGLLAPEMLVRRLQVDLEVDLEAVDLELFEQQEALEPFGMANGQPTWMVRGITPLREPVILKEKHLRLEFGSGRFRQKAIFFNGATHPLPRPPWDVAFHLERNAFNGRVDAQMQVVEIRSSSI